MNIRDQKSQQVYAMASSHGLLLLNTTNVKLGTCKHKCKTVRTFRTKNEIDHQIKTQESKTKTESTKKHLNMKSFDII